MRLHIGKTRPEQMFGPFNSQGLNLVHELAATVVALAGVAFCVFVGQL
jgi:hypothetical protein